MFDLIVVSGQRCPHANILFILMQVSHFYSNPSILYSLLPFPPQTTVQFVVLFFSSSSPSINLPPVSSSSSVDPLFMSFQPTLVLSVTVNAHVFFWRHFQRQLNRGWWQMLVLLYTANTPKAHWDWEIHTLKQCCAESISQFVPLKDWLSKAHNVTFQ